MITRSKSPYNERNKSPYKTRNKSPSIGPMEAKQKKKEMTCMDPVYPTMGPKLLEFLKTFKDCRIKLDSPSFRVLHFDSEEAFCSIDEEIDPGLIFSCNPNLSINVRIEIYNCCHSFQQMRRKIQDHAQIPISNHYQVGDVPMGYHGHFKYNVNIAQLFRRLHQANLCQVLLPYLITPF